MTEKQRVLQKLDAAIDEMDMAAIDSGLAALDQLAPPPAAEDPLLFAARIQQLQKEKTMKHSKKPIIAVATVAVVLLTGVTVYAATALNLFTLHSGDTYATVRTTQSMTSEEAQAMVDTEPPAEFDSESVELAQSEHFAFETLEEAQSALDIPIVLPQPFPGLDLESISGQSVHFGEDLESRTIWVNYGDPDEKALEVMVSRQIATGDADFTYVMQTDMDDGSLDSYRSTNGTVFTLFQESDETGERTAHIATVETQAYSYGLILVGFSEEEQKAMLDSLDLSVYR